MLLYHGLGVFGLFLIFGLPKCTGKFLDYLDLLDHLDYLDFQKPYYSSPRMMAVTCIYFITGEFKIGSFIFH